MTVATGTSARCRCRFHRVRLSHGSRTTATSPGAPPRPPSSEQRCPLDTRRHENSKSEGRDLLGPDSGARCEQPDSDTCRELVPAGNSPRSTREFQPCALHGTMTACPGVAFSDCSSGLDPGGVFQRPGHPADYGDGHPFHHSPDADTSREVLRFATACRVVRRCGSFRNGIDRESESPTRPRSPARSAVARASGSSGHLGPEERSGFR